MPVIKKPKAIAPMPLINQQLIDIDTLKKQVEHATKQNFTWFYSDVTGSTNSDLLSHKKTYAIAITESQKQGRGQRNNTWQASHADNVLFSIALPLGINEGLVLIPIKIGLAIKQALNQAGYQNIALKWPNDIFYKGKKLGGILIESMAQNNAALVVIGVGLNINMPYKNADAFIALKHKNPIPRTPLLEQCLISIFNAISHPQINIVAHFNQAHLFHLKPIRFNIGETSISGVCQGINKQGQLMIKTPNGLTRHSTGSIVMDSIVMDSIVMDGI